MYSKKEPHGRPQKKKVHLTPLHTLQREAKSSPLCPDYLYKLAASCILHAFNLQSFPS